VKKLDGQQSLKMLMMGNERFVKKTPLHPNQSLERRQEILGGQHPFAVILGCSDSRVPPEIIFDQGMGDLFVIRVAGYILNEGIIASIEYAVDHLAVPLVVVLGHQQCGAVKATVEGGEGHGHILHLLQAIQPAVKEAKGQPGNLLENAIRAHVRRVVQQLNETPPFLQKKVREGGLTIVGSYYDLSSGQVEIFPAGKGERRD